MCLWQDAYETSPRARGVIPGRVRNLHHIWGMMLENAVNELYADDVNHEFSFLSESRGGVRSLAFGNTREGLRRIKDESKRGGEIFLLGGIARRMGGSKIMKINDIDPRWFGRLTLWAKAHMGITTHQTERDRPRGGRPLPRLVEEEETESSSQSSSKLCERESRTQNANANRSRGCAEQSWPGWNLTGTCKHSCKILLFLHGVGRSLPAVQHFAV